MCLEEGKEKTQKSSKLANYQDKAKEKGISEETPAAENEAAPAEPGGCLILRGIARTIFCLMYGFPFFLVHAEKS